MFEKTYRQRLEADLAQWEADGVIAPAAAGSIRNVLPPLSPSINIAVVVAIVGGLLIAAAFLAFVAAHWTEIARLLRFAILLAGMLVAGALGAWFAATGRTVLADLCASIGAIIFGAGIALVGQMYHLGDDFAGGLLLWSTGAFAAAILTGSRGALAVGLAAACIWTCMRVYDAPDALHLQFVVAWLIAVAIAFAWNSRVAAHLVAVAAIPWWIATSLRFDFDGAQPSFVLANGAALLFGAGLAISTAPSPRANLIGSVLSVYGAFSLAITAFLEVTTVDDLFRIRTATMAAQPSWAIVCGVAGVVLALASAGRTRRAGEILAACAIGLVLIAAPIWSASTAGEPWFAYAALLSAMLCLVVSGVLDDVRPRIVAGWIGIAGVVGAITWAVKGSLLRRSAFLAVAGIIAVVFATALNRMLPRAER
ncbi:putative membrane protein [Bradyrhizobium sp. USDA 4472]